MIIDLTDPTPSIFKALIEAAERRNDPDVVDGRSIGELQLAELNRRLAEEEHPDITDPRIDKTTSCPPVLSKQNPDHEAFVHWVNKTFL